MVVRVERLQVQNPDIYSRPVVSQRKSLKLKAFAKRLDSSRWSCAQQLHITLMYILYIYVYSVIIMCVQETACGDFPAVVVEVAGRAFYTGVSRFVREKEDELADGFLLK